MNVRAEIIVKGVVQGVGFRFFTVQEAKTLGLNGVVGNLPNGDVKVVVEGEKNAILTLIKNLRIGPSFSHVTQINVDWQKPMNDFSDFRIVYY